MVGAEYGTEGCGQCHGIIDRHPSFIIEDDIPCVCNKHYIPASRVDNDFRFIINLDGIIITGLGSGENVDQRVTVEITGDGHSTRIHI